MEANIKHNEIYGQRVTRFRGVSLMVKDLTGSKLVKGAMAGLVVYTSIA